MRIDVDLVVRQIDEQEQHWVRGGGEHVPVGLADGARQDLVPDHAAVHVEKLRVGVGPLLARKGREAREPDLAPARLHLDQVLQEFLAEDLIHALA